MPLSQWNLEFLNHNAQRSFPLTADATSQDTTGSFRIPDDFIVGLDIALSPAADMETGRFLIRQLGLFASGVQLVFAYDNGVEVVDVASALVPFSAATSRNFVVGIGGLEPFDDLTGKVVIGRVDTLQGQPTGLFEFDISGSRIEPQAIRPMIKAISSLRVVPAIGQGGSRLYGDIELVAGTNIQLSTVSTADETQIIISAIEGEGTVEPCICEGDAANIPCIKTINGIGPTADGNFNFIGDDCLTFSGIENGLTLTDSCCAPCCGCEELEAITRDLERFNAQRATLELFVNDLLTETTTFTTTVLGARLGDRKCLTCE
jgi:hypothetical protein